MSPSTACSPTFDQIVSRDNAQGALAGVSRKLPRTALLHGLGIARHPDRLTLRLRTRDGTTAEVTLPARPIAKAESDARPCPPGWRFLPATLNPPLPLCLRAVGAAYWYEDQPEDGLLYAQINSVSDDPAEPFGEFVSRLFADLARRPRNRLVIDLRWNEGGNTFLTMPLLHRLIAYPGPVFVIIGRHTLSAAQNLSTFIANHTTALFIGEPTGSSPNFVGETAPFDLPYSRFQVNVSDLYWQSSWPMDHRTWLPPDVSHAADLRRVRAEPGSGTRRHPGVPTRAPARRVARSARSQHAGVDQVGPSQPCRSPSLTATARPTRRSCSMRSPKARLGLFSRASAVGSCSAASTRRSQWSEALAVAVTGAPSASLIST